MIINKFGQKVYTIKELNEMGKPEEYPFDEEKIKEMIRI